MPLYDYDCPACGLRFEVMHGVHADGPSACPACGNERVRKAFAAPAIHFKGSGWAKKERRAAVSTAAGKPAAAEDGSASDAGAGGSVGGSDGDAGVAGRADRDASGSTKREVADKGRDGGRGSGRAGGRDGSERASTPVVDARPAPTTSPATD